MGQDSFDKIGKKVNAFYETSPFPDYDLSFFNTKDDLCLAAYPFPKYLDKILPDMCSVLDVGCGTGQLAAFLSLKPGRKVVGIDFTQKSISKAKALKEKLDLSVKYQQGDILDPSQTLFSKEFDSFDYVLCTGVLHHTGNPELGFQQCCKLLKKGGYVVVGLYNPYGRMLLYLRKLLLKTIFRNNQGMKEYFIKKQIDHVKDKERARGWYHDQYEHPHETTHTVGEVLQWFAQNDIEFVNGIPALSGGQFSFSLTNILKKDQQVDPKKKYFFRQLSWIWTTRNDGGYFIMTGRKK